MQFTNSLWSIYKYTGKSNAVSQRIITATFDTAYGSQFIKQTTPNGLYDVYTIVGQSGVDGGTSLTAWADKIVNATFDTTLPRTIYYVCVGGGGFTYSISAGGQSGGGGAGAYIEGSYVISGTTNMSFTAGGSYKSSIINSTTFGTVTAGYGGYSDRNLQKGDNGINGSSGGGGPGSTSVAYPPGTGSPPGNNGGTAVTGATTKAAGGGGGAGGVGGNATSGVGGAGGAGKIPTSAGISTFYTSQLCVGGKGGSASGGNGTQSSTYGSGARGANGVSNYFYGQPGAIIIAVPTT